MLTTFLLSSAFVAGQAAPAAPAAQLPPVVKMQAAPMPPAVVAPMAPAAAPVEAPAAEAAPETPPATKYFLEKLLAGSSAGSMLENRGIKVFGATSGNYTASSASKTNAPITFNDFANAGQLNQNWFEVNKAIDTSKKEGQWGFRYAAILPGTDARFSIARGLGTVGTGDYPVDPMTYGYVEHFNPNLFGGTTIRVGKWGTAVGYEVIESFGGPFVSKSYNFQYNPFTHTGIQATTQVNDNLSVYYGAVTGSDVFIDPAATFTFVGGFKWAPKEGKNSLGVNVVVNNADFNTAENFANYDVFNAVFTHNFNDKLQYLLDATYSFCNNTPNNGNANWYGFANYFIRKHDNEKFVSTLRLEIFEDSQGFRTGTSGTYYEATYGLAYTPKDWLIVRPFARYDYNKNGAFESGDKNLYTGGIELIARW
ncbi:hypothetical protein BH11PLA2_BH11PLA2_03250 [soil metagenome]